MVRGTMRALMLLVYSLAVLFGLGWLTVLAVPAEEAATTVFRGESPFDVAGYSVAPAGDVNGDGLYDILIGARSHDRSRGRVYLIMGRQGGGWGTTFDLSQSDATFVGEQQGDLLGYSVMGVGDVDGDGLADFVLGAPDNSRQASYAGAAYLYFGRESADWGSQLNVGTADVIFTGDLADMRAGTSIAQVGDVNGDGLSDLLVGGSHTGPNGARAGRAYLVLGRPRSHWPTELILGAADAWFKGEPGEEAGTRVAGAGDVNGDGFTDFLVGAPVTGGGRVYLLLGGSALPWGKNTALTHADAIFLGAVPGDRAGISIASAGDVNRDGLNDVLIGADFSDEGGDRSGKVYLVLGRANADWGQAFGLEGADASFIGAGPRNFAGVAVAPASDFTGDGIPDFLIGAPSADASAVLTSTGCVYLVAGRLSGWTRNVNLGTAADGTGIRPLTGAHTNGSLGFALDRVGDVNGDGRVDLVLGEPFYDSGRVYLIPGQGGAEENLQVQKSGPETVRAAMTFTYSIQYANAGAQTFASTSVQDLLPVGVEFVRCTGGITRTHVGRLVSWQLGSLGPGDNGLLRLVVEVSPSAVPGAPLANCAWITSPFASSPVFSWVTTTVSTGAVTPTPTPTTTAQATATRTRTATVTAQPSVTATSGPSATPRACIPTLIAPPSGAVLDNGRTDGRDSAIWDFNWSDCMGATEYNLYVSREGASFPMLNYTGIVQSSYRHEQYGSYFSDANLSNWSWKVRARIGGVWGLWSEVRTFSIEAANTDPPSEEPTATATRTLTPAATRTTTASPTATRTPTGGSPLVVRRLYLPLLLKNRTVAPAWTATPTLMPTPSTTPLCVELAHDDGTAESSQSWEAGKGFGVAFSTTPGRRLLGVRVHLANAAPVEVHIWDASLNPLMPYAITYPSSDGWHDVVLSSLNLQLPGEFIVGVILRQDYRPDIGVDMNAPYGSSYEIDGAYRELKPGLNYMIRALVQ